MENAIRVLVIDDDEDYRASIQSFLEAEGYVVATAACGKEGLQQARTLRPDLVILDIMMESKSEGYVVNESLKYCHEYDACKDTAIIICSSIQNSPGELYPRAE